MVLFTEKSATFAVRMGECNDIAQMLALLHELQGIDFVRQLRLITERHEFSPLKDDPLIYTVGGERQRVGDRRSGMGSDDYDSLLDAARKAVEHGYRVFVLPNPKGFRTADFIFERKGVYKMFDLKTIIGKASVSSRLIESIGQTNHVVLNMATDYEARQLAKDIQVYFEANRDAREVLIMKGGKYLSVSRRFVEGRDYIKMFMKRYLK